jgi:hypothetical protein
MRRLAISIAAVIALSGLTFVAAPHEAAHAIDLPNQPTDAQCLATNPFARSATLAQRAAFSLDYRKSNGQIQSVRGIANAQGTALDIIPAPSITNGPTPPVAASTSAQLSGKGGDTIVRVQNNQGGVPQITLDTYSSGEPETATITSTPVPNTGLTSASAVAVAADDFSRRLWTTSTRVASWQSLRRWRSPGARRPLRPIPRASASSSSSRRPTVRV